MIHSKFKDSQGRTWDLALNLATLERVEEETGFAVDSLIPPPSQKGENALLAFHELLTDTRKIFKLAYSICREQADKLGVSRADFAAAIDGPALAEIPLALLKALQDFFPHPLQKDLASQLLKQGMLALRTAADRMAAELEKKSATMEADMNAAIDQALSSAATNSAEVSASTPGRSLSAD